MFLDLERYAVDDIPGFSYVGPEQLRSWGGDELAAVRWNLRWLQPNAISGRLPSCSGCLTGHQLWFHFGRLALADSLADGALPAAPFTGNVGSVHAVAVGKLEGRPVVVSGSGDRTVRVWELATGAQLVDEARRGTPAIAVNPV